MSWFRAAGLYRILIVGCFGAALMAGCAGGSGAWHDADADSSPRPTQVGDIAQLHVSDRCYLAGQPSPEDLREFKERGVTTVVNLRAADEMNFDEEKLVESLGMKYVHMPITGVASLTDGLFDRARKVFQSDDGRVLVHCASANRVGAIWLVHRVLDDGLSYDAALTEAERVGLRSEAMLARAQAYIDARRSQN